MRWCAWLLQWRWARPVCQATAGLPQRCSVQTLRGLYLWTFDGYKNVGGNLVLKAVMQGTRFNGDGKLVNAFGTVNIGGFIIIDATGGVGTYTVAADCTVRSQSPTTKLQHIRRTGWTAALDHPDWGRCWHWRRTGRGNGDADAVARAPRLLRRHRTSERIRGWRVLSAPPQLWQIETDAVVGCVAWLSAVRKNCRLAHAEKP